MNYTIPAVAAALVIVVTGCSATGDEQPVAVEVPTSVSTPQDSLDSAAPAESVVPDELPTIYWPDEPEVGVWYRLDMLDVEQCGYQTLTLPGDTNESEVFYFNEDASVVTVRPEFYDASLGGGNHLAGYGRLTAAGSIEFSGDTVNAIVSYEPTPAATVKELADPCE